MCADQSKREAEQITELISETATEAQQHSIRVHARRTCTEGTQVRQRGASHAVNARTLASASVCFVCVCVDCLMTTKGRGFTEVQGHVIASRYWPVYMCTCVSVRVVRDMHAIQAGAGGMCWRVCT